MDQQHQADEGGHVGGEADGVDRAGEGRRFAGGDIDGRDRLRGHRERLEGEEQPTTVRAPLAGR